MKNFVRVLGIAFFVGFIGWVATPQAATLYGEAPSGSQKGLGGIGIPVSWSNPNTVLYTCSNPNGFVMLHLVPRNASGTQPLTFTVSVVPGGGSTTLTTSSAIISNVFGVLSSPVITGTMGQSVVVTPLTTTTGSIVFDSLGYEGI